MLRKGCGSVIEEGVGVVVGFGCEGVRTVGVMEDRVLLSSSVMVGYVGSYGVIASGRGVGLCGRMCSGNWAGFRLGRSLWWDDGRVESRGKEIERVRCRGEVRMSAMPMKADAEVMEKRAQEELQKRLEESRERVSLLMGKLIIREAEENISRAEKQTIQSYPREKTGLQVTETYLENLQDIKADLERSMKDLELLKPEHGGVVDATKTIQRTTELYNTVASICSRIEEEPASTDEGEEPSPKLPPLEEVRKKVLNVGQGLEKSVGAFVREDGSIDFPGIRSAAQMSLDKVGLQFIFLFSSEGFYSVKAKTLDNCIGRDGCGWPVKESKACF